MKFKIAHISFILIMVLIIAIPMVIDMLDLAKQFETIPRGDLNSKIIVNDNETIDVIDQIKINNSQMRKKYNIHINDIG